MRLAPLALALAGLCALSPLPTQAQTPVNPNTVEFDPSADHSGVTPDNQPMVQRYELQIFASGASAPMSTADLGKPSPQTDGKIRVNFSTLLAGWPLGDGTYQARVAAIGPTGTGTSDPSNTFQFSSCSFTLGSTGQGVPSGGATGNVSVTTSSSCAWTAASAASWVTVNPASGSGSGSVGFVVTENLGTERVATLTIGGQAFTITQAAAAGCSYSMSPSSQSFNQGGGTGSVAVSCGSACDWTAATAASWITLARTSARGAASLGYTVAKNTVASARAGTITIAGLSYTVNQAAAKRPNKPKNVSVAATNGN